MRPCLASSPRAVGSRLCESSLPGTPSRLDSPTVMAEADEREPARYSALVECYERILDDVPCQTAEDYAELVTPNSNSCEPFHRWFRMKEAFSASFLPQVVKDCGFDELSRGLRILDPFSGSGTTAVAAATIDPGPEVWGVECNPFLHLVASVKHKAMQQKPSGLASLAETVIRRADARIATSERFPRPALSTYRNKAYFRQYQLRQVLALVSELDRLASVEQDLSVDILRVAAAAVVEPISYLRRDGRALRYSPGKARIDVYEDFRRRASLMDDDIRSCHLTATGSQLKGDGRLLTCIPDDLEFDLAVFSPPYPNNIDYTEVYKLEAWLLGLISNREEFREQRLRTMHSHPSIRRQLPTLDCRAATDLISPILHYIEPCRYAEALAEMLQGYAIDLVTCFEALARRMTRGGSIVCAVGNSLHGGGEAGFVIAADVLVMAAARIAGLSPQRIAVARTLTRRRHSSPLLRESVCFITSQSS